jgi:hypothetical protein
VTLASGPQDRNPRRRPDPHPWGPLSALWVSGSFSVALILILAGYVITSGTLRITGQLTGVNLGLAALVLELATGIGWTTRGFRSVRERQRLLVFELSEALGAQRSAIICDPATEAVLEAARVVVRRGTVHHLRTCPLAADKAVAFVGEQATSGRQACRVCQP